MPITITVPGVAVPKERPRLGKKHIYTPKQTKSFEKKVWTYAAIAQVKPIDKPIQIIMDFYLPDHRRIDIDNLIKSILDALNGKAWHDDAQVVCLTARKTMNDSHPRTVITIEKV